MPIVWISNLNLDLPNDITRMNSLFIKPFAKFTEYPNFLLMFSSNSMPFLKFKLGARTCMGA
jgi:hypothetical protein